MSIEPFSDHGLELDIKASSVVTVLPGTQTNVDILFTEKRLITGSEYMTSGPNIEDSLTFQVLAPVPGGGLTVVKQFATDIGVKSDARYEFYKASIPAGLTTRAIYKNNGVNPVKFRYNLIAHKDKVIEG